MPVAACATTTANVRPYCPLPPTCSDVLTTFTLFNRVELLLLQVILPFILTLFVKPGQWLFMTA